MSSFSTRVGRWAGLVVGAVFVAVTALPLVCKACRVELVEPLGDYRLPTTKPRLTWERASLEEYPQQFEAYFNDHFGLRTALMRGMHTVKGRWLGLSTAAHVLLGLDGWFYYTNWTPGSDYEGVRPFTPQELERWDRVLGKRRDWLARKGIHYVLFIPPDKQTVYPEHLPEELRPRHTASRLDQLAAYLREHSGVPVVDVRAAMRPAKERERLYHVTDSHWNGRGAFVGYEAVAGVLSGLLPGVRPLPRTAFADTVEDRPGGDLAQLVAASHLHREEWLGLEPVSARGARREPTAVAVPEDCPTFGTPLATENDDPTLPRAVMFHDSFNGALGPLLAEHFRRIVCAWVDQFSPGLVRRERPDVVIQEFVERKLAYVKPDDFDDSQD
jgi:hypothetical protein